MSEEKEFSRRAIITMSGDHLVRCDWEGNEKDLETHASISGAYWCKCRHCGKRYKGHTMWPIRHLEKEHQIKWWRKEEKFAY